MTAPVLQFKRGLLANLPGLRAGEPGFTTDSYDLYVGLTSDINTNKFFGSHRYWKKETTSSGSGINLVEGTSNGSDFITLAAPATVGAALTYYFPASQGAVSSVLTNDGNGNLSWASGSLNAVFSGITTIGGDALDVNVNSDFSGITTFSNTTDNTLGNTNTGAVQIDGGLGVDKNVTVGGGLSVTGQSYFIGTATFYGGTLNLGDSDADNINVAGEFVSNLVPNTDDTYDLGNGAASKRWRHGSFSGIGTFATGLVADAVRLGIGGNGVVDTTSGFLYLDSAGGTTIINDHVDIYGDLDVTGNISLGGTTITLRGEDVFIENKDLVLGYTTSVTPSDTTANHGGIAIASTEGSPLANFNVSGINTLPATYKQLMWFQSGTLGFATDTFAFNYGVAVGTTTMANGVRLAVGSGVTVSDTSVSATTFYGAVVGNVSSADQVKTVTASNNNANYHITFVDANNGSATNETIYTDDGIYYNPSTNKLTTQHAEFTGNVLVSGIATVGTGIGITQFSSSVSTGTSTSSVPTSSAVIDYVSAADIGLAGDSGSGSVNTTQTLTINGTANEVNTSVSGQTVIVGLPDDVIVGTSLSTPTVKVATLQHSNGTQAAVVDSSGNITASQNLTISGNLYVNGSTTQVNTESMLVEDRTIELGLVNGSTPGSPTTWDLGVLFNYNSSGAKKSAVIWEHADGRFKFGSQVTDGGGTDNNSPQITVSNYAPIEISALWVNDCAGQSQVISCTGTERFLENITVDAGTF